MSCCNRQRDNQDERQPSSLKGALSSLQSLRKQQHTSVVSTIAWHNNGKKIITGSYDTQVKIWDAYTGEVLETIQTGSKPVTDVAFHPKMDHIIFYACWSEEEDSGIITSFNTLTDSRQQIFGGVTKKHEIKAIALYPRSGDWIIGGEMLKEEGGTVRIWRVGQTAGEASSSTTSGNSNEESGDDVESSNNGIELLLPISSIPVHNNASIFSLCWSPGGDYFISASTDQTARKIEVTFTDSSVQMNFVQKYEEHKEEVFCVTIDSCSLFLFTGSGDTTAIKWSMETNELLKVYEGHTKHVRALAVDNTDTWLYTGSNDTTCRQFDIESGDCLRIFMHVPGIRGIDTFEESIVAAGMDGRSYIWRAGPLQEKLDGNGEMNMKPHALLHNIPAIEIFTILLENVIGFFQVLGFGFAVSYPWNPGIVNWLQKSLSALQFTIYIFNFGALFWTTVTLASFIILCFMGNIHGHLMDYISHLNAEGRGITKHWHYKEVIDYQSYQHMILTNISFLIEFLMFSITIIGFIPVLTIFTRVVTCSLQTTTDDIQIDTIDWCPTSAVISSYILGPIFFLVSLRLTAVSGDVTQLPHLHQKTSWNPIVVFYRRFFTSWRSDSTPMAGVLTKNVKNIWIFNIIQVLAKTALIIILITNSDSKSESVLNVFIISAGLAASIIVPPFVTRSPCIIIFISQLLLLWTMTIGVCVMFLNDPNSTWPSICWFLGLPVISYVGWNVSSSGIFSAQRVDKAFSQSFIETHHRSQSL